MKKASFLIVLVLTGFVALFSLMACSSEPHQIVPSEDSCRSCHSDTPTTYEVAEVSRAKQSGTSVMVETQASTITICKPLFTKEDASHFVPVTQNTVKVDGSPQLVELDEGFWTVCTQEDGTLSVELIQVDKAYDQDLTVTL